MSLKGKLVIVVSISLLSYFTQIYPYFHFHHQHEDEGVKIVLSIHPIDSSSSRHTDCHANECDETPDHLKVDEFLARKQKPHHSFDLSSKVCHLSKVAPTFVENLVTRLFIRPVACPAGFLVDYSHPTRSPPQLH